MKSSIKKKNAGSDYHFLLLCFMLYAISATNVLELRMVTNNYPVHIDSNHVSGGEYLPKSEAEFRDKIKDTILSDADNLRNFLSYDETAQFSF